MTGFWKKLTSNPDQGFLAQGARFVLIGGLNTLGTLVIYQLLLFVLPYAPAYVLSWLCGLAFVNIAYPLFVYGKLSLDRWETAANTLYYLVSLVVGWMVLFIFTVKAGVPPRLSIFCTLAVMVPLNYLATRHIYRHQGQGLVQLLKRNAVEVRHVGITCLLVAGLLAIFFNPQLTGKEIFPWDFVNGYHTNALAWYREGGFFSPPEWFAHGNFGFPVWTSLQDSGWFIPLSVMDFFGVPLSLPNIARLQLALMFLSGIGVYCSARRLGMRYAAATLAACIYVLGSGFFSNQEHVDVIRGYALLPWLLLVLDRRVLASRSGMACAALVMFQFLVAAYPGQVVAAFYTCLLYVLWQARDAWRAERLAGYLLPLALAGAAGLLMSMLKWWPVAASHAMLLSDRALRANAITDLNLLTFFFPSDQDFIRGDLTVRTLFIGMAAPALLFFARQLDTRKLVFAGMAIVSVLLGSLAFGHEGLVGWLPGVSVSRFQLLDYRGGLHLSLALLAGLVLDGWLSADVARRERYLRVAAGVVFAACIGGFGLAAGWGSHDVVPPLVLFLASLAVVAAMAGREDSMVSWRLLAGLIFINLFSVYLHVKHIHNAWNPPDYQAYEMKNFQQPIEELLAQPQPTSWAYRPPRLVVPADILSTSAAWEVRNPQYNREWYTGGFAAFGGDNMKRSVPHQALYAAFDAEAGTPGRPLLAFMLARSRVAVMDPARPFDSDGLQACAALQCGKDGDATVTMQSFGLDGADYALSSSAGFRMVENEVWYPGWQGALVDQDHAGAPVQAVTAEAFGPYLRSWVIPTGHWELVTSYHTPGRAVSWLLFWLGVAILLAYLGARLLSRPRTLV